jgi:hypothetical protein
VPLIQAALNLAAHEPDHCRRPDGRAGRGHGRRRPRSPDPRRDRVTSARRRTQSLVTPGRRCPACTSWWSTAVRCATRCS